MSISSMDFIVDSVNRNKNHIPDVDGYQPEKYEGFPEEIKAAIRNYMEDMKVVLQLKNKIYEKIQEWGKLNSKYQIGDKVELKDTFHGMKKAVIEDILMPVNNNFSYINRYMQPDMQPLLFINLIKKNGEPSLFHVYINPRHIKSKI